MATKTKPDRLYYTGNDEADRLIAKEPFALLIGFALDQQVPVPKAFSGPLELKKRLGTLDPARIAATPRASGSTRRTAATWSAACASCRASAT